MGGRQGVGELEDPDEPRSEADYIEQELEKMNDDGTTELEE